MPVCRLFFGLVNSRPRARFESSSFFLRCADFLDERFDRCSVGRWQRRRDRNGGVPAVGKNLLDRQGEPIGPCGQTRGSRPGAVCHPDPVLCGAGPCGYQLSRRQKENGDRQGRVLHCLCASGMRATAPLTHPRVFVHSLGGLLSLLASRAKESYQVSA